MRRTVLTFLILALGSLALHGQTVEFEVASIKRNTSDRLPIGAPPSPANGELVLRWVPPRILVTRAYPLNTVPIQVLGLPSWAESERYDVIAKMNPGTSQQDQQQMWRTLLADRMKLVAHYETRQRQGYDLVIAREDGKLGPQLRPSTLDCSAPFDPAAPPPPPPQGFLDYVGKAGPLPAALEQELMSRCHGTVNLANTTYAGAVEIAAMILPIMVYGRLDRPITDRTGLTGLYSVKLWFSRPSLNPPGPDDPPPLETALREQLGLKLVPTTIEGQVLVVDHIERPTEN